MADTKAFAEKVLSRPGDYGASLGVVQPEGDELQAITEFLQKAGGELLLALNDFRIAQPADYSDGVEAFGSMIRKPNVAPDAAATAKPRTADDLRVGTKGGTPKSNDDIGQRARLVAEYFARVFEHIGKTKFNNLGPHKLNGSDLFHGHLIKGWDNDMYVVFHAKEFPDDIPMEQQGGYETTDAAYAYRNVLWKGATKQVWALNAAGSLDGDRIYVYDRDSSEIFKNLIFPFSHADASPVNDSGVLLNKWTSVKTVYETYLGVPRAILCYRWMPGVSAHQRVVFNEQRGPGAKVTWDESKVDRLLRGPADMIPVEDVTGLATKQDAR